ncbi:MAG: helix-turn-helix domain-containing protein [Armatimonadetes bacterium]|nr:helix-turn-helix domain-containing protein [Armatimonadota bacterium]
MHYLTIAEAAEALHLSVPTIKRYIYEGKLRSTKLPGGQHRIPQSEIDRILSPEAAPGARMEEAAPPFPRGTHRGAGTVGDRAGVGGRAAHGRAGSGLTLLRPPRGGRASRR